MLINELMEVPKTCASEDNEVGDIILRRIRYGLTVEEEIDEFAQILGFLSTSRFDPWNMPRSSAFQRMAERRQQHRLRPMSRWFTGVTRPNRPEDLHAVCPRCNSTRTKPCFELGRYRDLSSRHCESCHHCWPHLSPISHSPSRTFFYATEYNHVRPDSYLPTHSFSQTVGGQSSPAQHVSIDIPDVDDTVEPNRVLQPYPPTDEKWVKLAEIVLGISAGAGYTSSSSFPKAANAVGFLASLMAISLCHRTGRAATRILIKFGAVACAAGILAAIGNDLPDEYRWIAAVAFLIPATSVAFA